MTCVVNLTAT